MIVIGAADQMHTARRGMVITDHPVFLRKPFDLETLLAIVQGLTGS